MEYKHIFIDADDTLLDFAKAQRESFILTMQFYGVPFSEELLMEFININHRYWEKFEEGILSIEEVQRRRFEVLFDNLNICRTNGQFVNRIFQKQLKQQSWLMPNAIQICKYLYPKAIISIITNGVATTQRYRMRHSGLMQYVSHIIISEDIGVSKPNIDFFNIALSISGCIDKNQVLIVGDSLSSDILGAKNIGIDSCWYNPMGQQKKEGLYAKYSITDLLELREIVK